MLSVFAAIVRRLKQAMEPEVPKVLAAVFEPTLQVSGIGVFAQQLLLCKFDANQVLCALSRGIVLQIEEWSLLKGSASCLTHGVNGVSVQYVRGKCRRKPGCLPQAASLCMLAATTMTRCPTHPHWYKPPTDHLPVPLPHHVCSAVTDDHSQL